MLRSIYRSLIRAHPRGFRRLFGSEMIWIFDQAADHRARLSLLADALLSVLRQRWLRPVTSLPRAAAQTVGMPAFSTLDTSLPPSMLLWGAIVSLVLVLAAASAPRSVRPPLRSHGTALFDGGTQQRTSAPEAPSGLANQLRRIWSALVTSLGSSPSTGLVPTLAAGYLQPSVPARQQGDADVLLGILDTNGDLILTPSEIERAPAVLRLLDGNFDGLLTWRECEVGRDQWNVARRRSRLFSALDSTGNGIISSGERLLGAEALTRLDTNRDGRLTRREWEEKQ